MTQPEETDPVSSIPVLGAIFAGLSEAFDALLSIGADMRPEVRATAKKVVISAIIVTQIAAQAAQLATASVRRMK